MISGKRCRGRVSGLVVLLLVLATFGALALGAGLAAFPRAHASPEPQLTISPTEGAVGTPVTVTLIPMQDSVGMTYRLDASMVGDPNVSTPCDPKTVQPIPGLAPFVVAQGENTLTFDWPTSLDQGPYWLCANPNASAGIAYISSNQFTVDGAVPTATPLPTASAVVNASLSGVLVGSTFTISLSHWSAISGTPPQSVMLTTTAPPVGSSILAPNMGGVQGTNAQFTTAPGPNPGDYTLTVTVPKVDPTVYYVAVETSEQSFVYGGVLAVKSPAAPASTPSNTSTAPSNASSGNTPSLLVVGALLALALVMLAAFLLRRYARTQRLKAEQQLREQQMREQQYRQQQQFYGQQPPATTSGPWAPQYPQPSQPAPDQWQRAQTPPRDPHYPRR